MGSGGIYPTLLTSALDGGEWSVPLSGCFIPRETATITHCIGNWEGPAASLDTVESKTNFYNADIIMLSSGNFKF
jgi:hypothetical protein